MDAFIAWLTSANDWLNGIVWGWPMIILILGTGIFLTILTKFLQVRKFGTSCNETIVPTIKSIVKKKDKDDKKKNKEKTISPFEAFATAISGTVGTGNIVGVTAAIMSGGPGAVCWMWISAFFGMVTNYSENVLGMYYRKKGADGEFAGGPAYYLSEGLAGKKGKGGEILKVIGKILAVAAACFCLVAAIGMSGVQTNKIAATFQNLSADPNVQWWIGLIVGIVVAIVLALVILGGIKSIGRVTSILVPFMSLLFILMAIVVIFANIGALGGALASIFTNMFGFDAAAGGVVGFTVKTVTDTALMGFKRGIFSNEAGLGSSVIAHSASQTREPVKQGFWGIFEVFFDTFIICTLTALVILVSTPAQTLYGGGSSDVAISMGAFSSVFGAFGTIAYSIILPLFAFTTILAWSYYGEKSIEFLFSKTGEKGKKIAKTVFKILYVVLVVFSAVNPSELAWAISDTSNALMALPNLIGLVIMGGLVAKLTQNYLDRKAGKNIEPMLSAYPEQNEQFKKDLSMENDVAEEEQAPQTQEAEEVAPTQE